MFGLFSRSYCNLKYFNNVKNLFIYNCRMVKHISGKEAFDIDQKLMGDEYGFSVDQLMELAGLAVAKVCYKQHPPIQSKKVLVLVGPGNNGGDGLVAARHLKHYGYKPYILYPKQPQKSLYINLLKQCKILDIPISSSVDEFIKNQLKEDWELILDGLFGFSFKPPIRSPFDDLIPSIIEISKDIPLVSIDIPSGWDVENGPETISYQPATLVSLTAPKNCASHFTGNHWLGGRFVPELLEKEYQLELPVYPGSEDVVLLP